ncbi:hypothetical protein [Streptomyces violaceorubidus]|uniref:hypothetical protein n=1 Tax=Streptomyces violaceorubidus TaxID=284042 RepID=UPI0004BF560B|nr:hypothetical protein [Streptomyces violaceorubidus]
MSGTFPPAFVVPPPPGFGAVLETPEVSALRRRLHGRVLEIVSRMPRPLAEDVAALLGRHGRTRTADQGDLFVLFPAPVWSFLHWVPAARQPDAERLHAAALLLHLWDDHLTDGQLAPDLAALHLRTELWRCLERDAAALCAAWGADPGLVAGHTERYLSATHAPRPPADLDSYCATAREQAALWTLLPRLLETGGRAEAGWSSLVEDFAVAWRLVDDAADVRRDAVAGIRSAVWWQLPGTGRAQWDARSPLTGRTDTPGYGLGAAPRDGSEAAGCAEAVTRVLARAAALLAAAVDRAAAAGEEGVATELLTARAGVLTSARRPW